VGLTFLAVAMGWIALTLSATLAYSAMWPPFLLAGIGMGLVFAPSSTAVLANMKPEDHAKASGTNSTLREVGVALGIAVLTAVFTGAGGTLTPTGYVDAAIPAVWVGAGVLALAAVISLALPSGIRRLRRTPDTVEELESAVAAEGSAQAEALVDGASPTR
jgi:hypothetical protein